MKPFFTLIGLLVFGFSAQSQTDRHQGHLKFKQFEEEWPTPNVYRTASGAPGPQYYQQKADYYIKVSLNDDKQILSGEELITYTNNAPESLSYLWIQLDQNMRSPESISAKSQSGNLPNSEANWQMGRMFPTFPGGFRLTKVTDAKGNPLKYTINNTMMRIDLSSALVSGAKTQIKIEWWYPINNRMAIGGRSGYEYFEADKNYLYTIAQFFPRMAVYNDVYGWQNKQFLGTGEFTLPFGDYVVEIDVPADHVVAATGDLVNADKVLSKEQLKRLKAAENDFENPVLIINQSEAMMAEKSNILIRKVWRFEAKNVRDFAFASSRKFIWDAMATNIGGKKVMAMSYYPKEGNPLWEKYSTRVVAHTLKSYSKYTINYPYPKAISVHSAHIGMEYPMISFNGGRPEADGTYSSGTKHGMISVIIHEVGHNFFPMIVNSDERQWTWMDEGLNTFMQFIAEQEWDRNYPSRRGPAEKIVDYMKGDKMFIVPIMTNSESLMQFGNNAYGKPATALNILRETVMGRELFDAAFKYYCERWAFKHPSPADFFRTMEDASAVDLDWFWRGWFYTVDHCDMELRSVNVRNKPGEDALAPKDNAWELCGLYDDRDISARRNDTAIVQSYVEKYPVATDEFTGKRQPGDESFQVKLPQDTGSYHYVEVEIENKGGLIMPIILRFHFEDGSAKVMRIPVEVWLRKENSVIKSFRFKGAKTIAVELDPYRELADTDRSNNFWPPKTEASKFDKFMGKKDLED